MTRTANVQINFNALLHNLGIAKRHAEKAKVMAVIKANAYGHGMVAVAEHLQQVVDALAVACVSEAIALREAGISARIVVLQGFQNSQQLQDCQHHQLDVVCHQIWQVDMLAEQQAAIGCWIKYDTGMHRLGLSAEETLQAFQKLAVVQSLRSLNLMSHFANADSPEHPLNQQQIDSFNQLEQQLQNDGFDFETSFSNSAAIINRLTNDKHWVRPGIMLYGATPMAEKMADELGLQAVMQFESQVIAVHPVAAGGSVGYGSDWVAEADSEIAVIAVGYGDGYPRHAASGTPVVINGQRFPLAGRVSMDMICVDVSTATTKIKPGDMAVIWGAELAVDEVAACAETIGYELLCHAGAL